MNNLKFVIIAGYLVLTFLGLLMLTSIAPDRVAQQAALLFFGSILMLYLSTQDIAIFRNFAIPFYLFALILLISTYIFGDYVRGALRWIDLFGLRLQTSELVKPLLIISFAYFLERFPPTTIKGIFINLSTFLLPAFLIFRQPDLGTSLVIFAIWGVMVFMAQLPLWVITLGALGLVGASYFSPLFLKPYQLERLRTFFDPYQDPLGSGYNVIQAIIAIGSGQILGVGLGNGTQSHFRFLPERHTDFMFASLAEELGLIGAGAVVIIFAAILYALVSTILILPTYYPRLVLAGVFGYIAFQFGINTGMNLGIAPVTGVTLPLVSYGGSSVLATALAFGLALSASRSAKPLRVLEIK